MNFYSFLKQIFCVLAFLVAGLVFYPAQGQHNFGNEWINHSQTYYKIRVINNGLHRLSYGYLDSLGLASANPKHFQIYRRGKEISLYVAGEADGRLDREDYIEFFGERNDGAMDSELYKHPEYQFHQQRSFYTDTAAYFLTVSATTGGKRMRETITQANGRTPEAYHIQKALAVYADAFYRGKKYAENLLPWIDLGQGYTGSTSRFAKNFGINNVLNAEPAGFKPILNFGLYARNDIVHHAAVNILPASGGSRLLSRFTIIGFGQVPGRLQIEFGDISAAGQVIVQTAPDAYPTTENQFSLSYATVTFPQKSIVTGNMMVFFTDSTRSVTPYYEFSGATAATFAFDITDQTNISRIAGRTAGSKIGYAISAEDGRSHRILLADVTRPIRLKASMASKVNFRNIRPEAHNYIVLTNKRLMQRANGSALPAPKEYTAYRASLAGGKYDTLLVYVDDIVNQYHYGDFSSNAITRFLKHMTSSPKAKQLFILGKGVEFDRINYRSAASAQQDLVPTGGVPGSDLLFSTDIRNNAFTPKVPTGRLSVTTPAEIINYLDKVKEHEGATPGEPWQKNILHLGGGTNTNEINSFVSYLNFYESIAKGPLFGANVIKKTRKNVSEVVENINVSEEINRGTSLVTFFGHSSTGSTDLDIGLASSPVNGYANKGKYPVMLMNGCLVGNMFLPSQVSFGEDWIKTPERGAIGFIAHVELGYSNFLNNYTTQFYYNAFQNPNFYGKPLGIIQQETIRRVNESNGGEIVIAMVMEMLLQGDPAVKIHSPAKPDYYVKDNSLKVLSADKSVITATSADFILKVGVNNYGKALPDSVQVSVKRTLADNTVLETKIFKVKPIILEDTLHLRLNNKEVNALGLNTFEVHLDNENKIAELNEENNISRFQYFFPASSLMALSPQEYGIVGSKQVKLIVQATQATSLNRGVHFEIDTAQTFNSPLKRTHAKESAMMPSWELTLPGTVQDSTVYYWRARFQHYEVGEDTIWATNSFRYIPRATGGWSQSHYGQFDKVKEEGVSNKGIRQLDWKFDPLTSHIEIRTVGGAIRYSTPAYGLIVDGKNVIEAWCSDPTGSATPRMYMMVMEPNDLIAVTGIVPAYACGNVPTLYEFGDLNNAANRAKIETFLKAVPNGYHVAAISINRVPFESFTATQKEAFKSIGSSLITNLKNGFPFAIVGRKGAVPGSVVELTAEDVTSSPAISTSIILNAALKSGKPSGKLTSSLIGPALHWKTLHHNIERLGAGNDKYKLSVIGITSTGQEEVLVEDVKNKDFDLSRIDAKRYPHLQLSALLSDSANRSAPQLKQWMVYYDVSPEGIIRPDLVKVSEQILTDQANKKGRLTVPMAFQNISSFAFRDSVLVEVTLTGDGIQPKVYQMKIAPTEANTTATFNFSVPLLSLGGNYRLSMFVNPRVQPEQHYFNNFYEVAFSVKPKLHPVLNVAFDGVHILDGELISSSPLVSITVKDEHRQDFLKDPSGMSVILITPTGQEQEVNLLGNEREVRYYPADEKNDFRVEYKPVKLENGKYTMLVNARDVAGKPSGILPYRISFEIQNEASVSNFYPFPNPFSSKTQFIFTLTGSTVPENFKIQILTVTGKVVKEIEKEELGPIRIGNNKTEYTWDGTDTYGDRLANGVYLYRVVMSQGDEEMKHRRTRGDQAFSNGYGKLYILR